MIFRDSSDYDDIEDDDDDPNTSDGDFIKREGRSKFYQPDPETLSQASIETETAEFSLKQKDPTTHSEKDLP